MPLHPRRALEILQARLANRTITVLTGARQTGKTTLVRDLLPAAADRAPVYLSPPISRGQKLQCYYETSGAIPCLGANPDGQGRDLPT
jgi:hypothetical protein